jgi:hypothetical protein
MVDDEQYDLIEEYFLEGISQSNHQIKSGDTKKSDKTSWGEWFKMMYDNSSVSFAGYENMDNKVKVKNNEVENYFVEENSFEVKNTVCVRLLKQPSLPASSPLSSILSLSQNSFFSNYGEKAFSSFLPEKHSVFFAHIYFTVFNAFLPKNEYFDFSTIDEQKKKNNVENGNKLDVFYWYAMMTLSPFIKVDKFNNSNSFKKLSLFLSSFPNWNFNYQSSSLFTNSNFYFSSFSLFPSYFNMHMDSSTSELLLLEPLILKILIRVNQLLQFYSDQQLLLNISALCNKLMSTSSSLSLTSTSFNSSLINLPLAFFASGSEMLLSLCNRWNSLYSSQHTSLSKECFFF